MTTEEIKAAWDQIDRETAKMAGVISKEEMINELVARKLCAVPKRYQYRDAEGVVQARVELFPDYCRSIEAAWEIVDWLIAKNYHVNLYRVQREGSPIVFFYTREDGSHRDIREGFGYTAPMAICLAFLKLP